MSITVAHNIIKQFGFSEKELNELTQKLKGNNVTRRTKKKVMTADRAEVLFTAIIQRQ